MYQITIYFSFRSKNKNYLDMHLGHSQLPAVFFTDYSIFSFGWTDLLYFVDESLFFI